MVSIHVYGNDMDDPANDQHENKRNMNNVPQGEKPLVRTEPGNIDDGIQVLTDCPFSRFQPILQLGGIPLVLFCMDAPDSYQLPGNHKVCPM